MAEIRSPMVGTVLEILVSVGGQVSTGDEIILLESMKMEIPVVADGAGRIAEIKVTAGDSVQEGDLLVVLE